MEFGIDGFCRSLIRKTSLCGPSCPQTRASSVCSAEAVCDATWPRRGSSPLSCKAVWRCSVRENEGTSHLGDYFVTAGKRQSSFCPLWQVTRDNFFGGRMGEIYASGFLNSCWLWGGGSFEQLHSHQHTLFERAQFILLINCLFK